MVHGLATICSQISLFHGVRDAHQTQRIIGPRKRRPLAKWHGIKVGVGKVSRELSWQLSKLTVRYNT